jgi:hypothetical protein
MTNIKYCTWNYISSNPALLPMGRISFDYNNNMIDGKFGWDVPWDWNRVFIRYFLAETEITGKELAKHLKLMPVVDWVNVYHWGLRHGAPPHDFSPEGIECVRKLMNQTRQTLTPFLRGRFGTLNVHGLYHIFDFENPNCVDTTMIPHLATASYLASEALVAAKWQYKGAANYNTAHHKGINKYGKEPNWRASPYNVIGAFKNDVHFHSGYWIGGPDGCLQEDEVLDVINKSNTRLWLALEDYQPGMENIIKTAKLSGKVELIAFWGHGGLRKDPIAAKEKDDEIVRYIESV